MMRARRARRIEELRQATSRARHANGHLVRVRSIRQYARTGTKCYLEYLDGRGVAAWFRTAWPRRGFLLIVQGGFGGGEHHGEYVLYVNGVYEALSKALWRYRRHVR